MISISQSPLFRAHVHPDTGITSHLLDQRVAPQQQTFYYVNDGSSRDRRFFWFYCAFPPSGDANAGRTLGVIDFVDGDIRHFPETQFSHASPWVDPDTGEVFWGTGRAIWKRGPRSSDRAEKIGEVPKDLIGWRDVTCTVTHLSRSADGREFFIDLRTPAKTYLGTMTIATGAFDCWAELDGTWDHAQFHPTDPDLVLFSQEIHVDPITGRRISCDDRMWTLRRGESPRPVLPTPTVCTHEWWSADGRAIYAIDGDGTFRVDLATRRREPVWPGATWHTHANSDDTLLVGDRHGKFFRGCESRVTFKNLPTGRQIEIAHNPELIGEVGSKYHIDPHPRFVLGEEFVAYTTTVRGRLDVAFTATADLLAATA